MPMSLKVVFPLSFLLVNSIWPFTYKNHISILPFALSFTTWLPLLIYLLVISELFCFPTYYSYYIVERVQMIFLALEKYAIYSIKKN